MPVESLARAAGDFFATVLLVTEAPEGRYLEVANLRAQLITQLDALGKHPAAASLEPGEAGDARFALACWADETLLKSGWAGREEWGQELLQLALYRTNTGGDEFYERLGRLRPDQNAARTVFLLCLVFGFEGNLLGDEGQRQAAIQQHYDMLRAAGYARDAIAHVGRMTPAAYDNLEIEREPPPSGTIFRILLRWGGAAAALFAVLFGVLFLLALSVELPPGA